VRFMDLPQTHQLVMELEEDEKKKDEEDDGDIEGLYDCDLNLKKEDDQPPQVDLVRTDPLSCLAEAAGFSDGERWWDHMVESRQDSSGLFNAITEAMAALRSEALGEPDKMEPYREAHMRNTIRAAEKEGFKNIAVVCGAWHAPALSTMPPQKDDNELLKGLPKVKVEATWVPWTHSRLSYANGYGAGVTSPGWYHHLWTSTDLVIERWLTMVARLLRKADLDASSAHIIESVRLAEALAALRGRAQPGLQEITESIQSVLLFGNNVPLKVIHEKLIVGQVLGKVPETTPSVPLQIDLAREQKRLRMPAEDAVKQKKLDLREETDRARSHLLHRLNLLEIPWGHQKKATGKGTFWEEWETRWQPEFSLRLIEAGRYGKTVAEAATQYTREKAAELDALPPLTELLDKALLADVGEAAQYVMARVQSIAAVAGDITHLMDAIPPLVRVARYGNVRKTDVQAVEHVTDGLIARTCIGLPAACTSINDDAALPMYGRLNEVHSSIQLLQNEEHDKSWTDALTKLADGSAVHGTLAGRACRLLLDTHAIDIEEAARRFGLALSIATGPTEAAGWVSGFLSGSGLVLIHDDALWGVVDNWVLGLSPDQFNEVLPLVRRTFSAFPPAERRQMGQRVTSGVSRAKTASATAAQVDESRGDLVLPVVAKILGLE
jgi:hypothetical protein